MSSTPQEPGWRQEFAQCADKLTTDVRAGKQLPDQANPAPKFWIGLSHGMSGHFATMFWNGGGFPEPWSSGQGRYRTSAEAEAEGRQWALEEKLEFVR